MHVEKVLKRNRGGGGGVGHGAILLAPPPWGTAHFSLRRPHYLNARNSNRTRFHGARSADEYG